MQQVTKSWGEQRDKLIGVNARRNILEKEVVIHTPFLVACLVATVLQMAPTSLFLSSLMQQCSRTLGTDFYLVRADQQGQGHNCSPTE